MQKGSVKSRYLLHYSHDLHINVGLLKDSERENEETDKPETERQRDSKQDKERDRDTMIKH